MKCCLILQQSFLVAEFSQFKRLWVLHISGSQARPSLKEKVLQTTQALSKVWRILTHKELRHTSSLSLSLSHSNNKCSNFYCRKLHHALSEICPQQEQEWLGTTYVVLFPYIWFSATVWSQPTLCRKGTACSWLGFPTVCMELCSFSAPAPGASVPSLGDKMGILPGTAGEPTSCQSKTSGRDRQPLLPHVVAPRAAGLKRNVSTTPTLKKKRWVYSMISTDQMHIHCIKVKPINYSRDWPILTHQYCTV